MDTKYLQELRDIANMARDAERYRKLRDCHWDLGGIVIVDDPDSVKLGRLTLTRERLDDAVDNLV